MRKKTQKNIHHEYISTKQYYHGLWFRLSNIFVLLAIVTIDKFYQVGFSDLVYVVPISAIVGYDISGFLNMFNKFIGKRKNA